MRCGAFKVMTLFFTLILLLGVTGCMKKESLVEKMISHMNEKYNDHFEYIAPFGGGAGTTSTQILVKSQKFPDAQIWVEYRDDAKNLVFIDNYVSYKYEEQVRKMLADMLAEVFGENVKFHYCVPSKGVPNNFDEDTTLMEFCGSNDAQLTFNAVVSSEYALTDTDLIEKAFTKALSTRGIVVDGYTYFSRNAEEYQSFTDLSSDTLAQMPLFLFYMATPTIFDAREWRNINE